MNSSENSNFFPDLYLEEFDRALDAQCRVSLPADWRKKDGETELVMIPARGEALVLLPKVMFLEFVDKARKLAIANPKMQMAFAYLGSKARQCKCDKQGRINLDRKMLDGIGVVNQLKMIGALNHIRICAPQNWDSEQNAMDYLDEIQKVSDGPDDVLALLSNMIGKNHE